MNLRLDQPLNYSVIYDKPCKLKIRTNFSTSFRYNKSNKKAISLSTHWETKRHT